MKGRTPGGASAGPSSTLVLEASGTWIRAGDGSPNRPYEGWERALASGRTLVLAENRHHRFPDAGAVLPSDSTLRCEPGATLRFGADRPQVRPGLLIPSGTKNVTIEGCTFHAGVEMAAHRGPAFLRDGTGGASYIEIGSAGSSAPAERVSIRRNEFTTMRHSAGDGFHIEIYSARDLRIGAGNRFDRAKAAIVAHRGHATAHYLLQDVNVVQNIFDYAHEHDSLGGVIEFGREDEVVALESEARNVVVSHNRFHNVDGGVHFDIPGGPYVFSHNELRGPGLDFCLSGNTVPTRPIEDVSVVGNSCIGTHPNSVASLDVWYWNRASVRSNTVITQNTWISPIFVRGSRNSAILANRVDRSGAADDPRFSRCIAVSGGSSDLLIADNELIECNEYGLLIDGGNGIILRGNQFYDTEKQLSAFVEFRGVNSRIELEDNVQRGRHTRALSSADSQITRSVGNVLGPPR